MTILSQMYFLYSAINNLRSVKSTRFKNTESDDVYLSRAMEWLVRAAEVKKNKGLSHSYAFLRGWRGSYPETVGYIIPTFFKYSKFKEDKTYSILANNLSDWLIDVQMDNGATMGGIYNKKPVPIVFNTGQNIFGFLSSYEETNNKKYLEAAKRSGNFLVKSFDGDTWITHAYRRTPHSYNTRTSWGLLKLWKETANISYLNTAKLHLDWVCNNTHDNGFFENCRFDQKSLPNTHLIAYTIRGLLESYLILNEKTYLSHSDKISRIFANILLEKETLVSNWDSKYNPKSNFVCLTGLAQLSIIWFKLHQITNDSLFLEAACKALEIVKFSVSLNKKYEDVCGAVPGSFPITGKYASMQYPNWATKFFADALMLKDSFS